MPKPEVRTVALAFAANLAGDGKIIDANGMAIREAYPPDLTPAEAAEFDYAVKACRDAADLLLKASARMMGLAWLANDTVTKP